MTRTKTFRNRYLQPLETADQEAIQTGRGGGARGGKTPNNNGKNPPKNSGPMGAKKQSKDAEGIYNFLQSSDGKVSLNHRGHPMCYYCGIPSHQRTECRLRLRDVDNGIKRPFHPA